MKLILSCPQLSIIIIRGTTRGLEFVAESLCIQGNLAFGSGIWIHSYQQMMFLRQGSCRTIVPKTLAVHDLSVSTASHQEASLMDPMGALRCYAKTAILVSKPFALLERLPPGFLAVSTLHLPYPSLITTEILTLTAAQLTHLCLDASLAVVREKIQVYNFAIFKRLRGLSLRLDARTLDLNRWLDGLPYGLTDLYLNDSLSHVAVSCMFRFCTDLSKARERSTASAAYSNLARIYFNFDNRCPPPDNFYASFPCFQRHLHWMVTVFEQRTGRPVGYLGRGAILRWATDALWYGMIALFSTLFCTCLFVS